MKLWQFLFSNPVNKQLEIHNHGHRCYSEGLTAYEQHLVSVLAKNLDPDNYYIFNNVTLPSTYTTTTQIDHIVVSINGIFVIESKDFTGWIFGNKNRPQWTHMSYKMKYKFQNPLFQNFAHVSALKEQLPFIKKCIFNVVVFSNNCEIKTERICNVLYEDEIADYILSKSRRYLQEEEMLLVIGKLSLMCQSYQVSTEEHVANLDAYHGNKYLGRAPIITKIPVANAD